MQITRYRNIGFAILVAMTTITGMGRNIARGDEEDDKFTGPGWYEIFYSTGVHLIYSGPYASEDACWSYTDGILTADYIKNMSRKYGKYNDVDNGWLMECRPLKTKAEWIDLES